ncbi:glycosyltransferase family 1 protein [uncultured Oscillibacter sp.]|uniref:glycosyltransferase family 4 protein n=1 Tax=uncultured Oscillibacter sp. TaxID=876091 RepID=UPI0025DC5379|nr:glycosyltransferase family 1 protein [uncultured Oscillibacter sp.]
MKVALELQPCCGQRSGIGTYTYELARRLQDGNGLEFSGNLFNFRGANDHAAALRELSMPIRENRQLSYGVYRRIWHAAPLPYQALFPDTADLHVFFDYIVPPRIGGKTVTTIHDLTYLRYPQTMQSRNRRRIQRDIRYSLDRSSRIVTITEFSKRELIELLAVPEENISIVSPAPSLSAGCTPWAELTARYPIRGPYLLYVGNLEPRKNLPTLLLAFHRLQQETGLSHQLVLAGNPGWKNDEVHRRIEALGLSERVVFTGYVSGADKNALYQNAALFVFPSLYEGFGIPPLEAMHFGCPVVCARAASLPEVAGDAAAMADPLDSVGLAEAMWRVLSDGAYAAGLVERGYRQAQKYNWDASAEKLTALCKAVLGER